MPHPEALNRLNIALRALAAGNTAEAKLHLDYAAAEWPDQCDLHRALAYTRTASQSDTLSSAEVSAVRDTLDTYGAIIATIDRSEIETAFGASWELPLMPIRFTVATRGQFRAAHAAVLIEKSRFDEAKAELLAARREKVVTPDRVADNDMTIAAVECLLYLRTARWNDLLAVSADLAAYPASGFGVKEIGNAFAGTALVHLGSNTPGREKLTAAVNARVSEVAGWASLQLGLALRAAGEETLAQETFTHGLQFTPRVAELNEAARNTSITPRVTTADLIEARTDFWDPGTEPDRAVFERESTEEDRRRILAETMEELNLIEGMEAVKVRVRELAAEVRIENEQRRRGLSVKPKSRHMVFTGPPGTGKTTIAQLVGKLYYGLGVTPKPVFVQTDRAEITGVHWGEAAKGMERLLEKARGGVLFIDEAYGLVQEVGPGQKDPYGEEALTTLLNRMEMWRDELVVVVAGYEAEMERFLSSNEGFRSRFPITIKFKTYTADEMWRIFRGMVVAGGRTVEPEAEALFKKVIDGMWAEDHTSKRFLDSAGNGRFARTVFEQAQAKAYLRLDTVADVTRLSDEELMMLTTADIAAAMRDQLQSKGIAGIMD